MYNTNVHTLNNEKVQINWKNERMTHMSTKQQQTIEAGDTILEIETGRVLTVESVWGHTSNIVDFSAYYLPPSDIEDVLDTEYGNRGFRFQDEGVIWRKQTEEEEEEYFEVCPAGTICSQCHTEIKEMYDEHPCLGHFCQCGRNYTD